MEAQQQHATQARQGRLQPVGHVSRPLALNGSSEQVVTLCVGGTLYSTTRGTLTAVAGSYLAILFGDDSDWQPTSVLPGSQTPFIDRDGELFRFVLAYLRTVKHCQHQQPLLLLPDNPMHLQQLRAEADFYVLPGRPNCTCIDGSLELCPVQCNHTCLNAGVASVTESSNGCQESSVL